MELVIKRKEDFIIEINFLESKKKIANANYTF